MNEVEAQALYKDSGWSLRTGQAPLDGTVRSIISEQKRPLGHRKKFVLKR